MCRSGPHHLVQRVDDEISHQRGRKHRAVRDPAGELGLLGSEQDLAHQRMHPVGADHGIGMRAGAVGEAQRHARTLAVEAGELFLVDDQLRRHGGEQRRVQIAAMHEEVGRAVARLGLGAECQLGQVLAGIPHAGGPGAGLEGLPFQLRLQPERAQHAHRVGAHLDAGADALELPAPARRSSRWRPAAPAARPAPARRCRRR